jgi:hypothetical protein
MGRMVSQSRMAAPSPAVSGAVSDQRSNDRGERVARAGAEDEVGEADFLPSPLDFLGCRRRVGGEDGQ